MFPARRLLALTAVMAIALPAMALHDMMIDNDRHLKPGVVDDNVPEQTVITNLNPALIGGTVADPADWPASPWVGNCSSTLVGPRVLETAAHCVSNGGTKSFTIGATRYTATCTHHPSYRGNSTADWALCVLPSPVPNVPYESLAKPDDFECRVGAKVLWTGYGCTRWGGQLDGRFRTGEVGIIRCPSGTNYDIVTRGSVALCSGDSGGGGYDVSADGSRRVIGKNSRSNTTDTSYVSSTATQAHYTWAMSWASSKGVQICGYHEGVEGCRGASPDPDPQPDPDPAPDCSEEIAAVVGKRDELSASVDRLAQCLK